MRRLHVASANATRALHNLRLAQDAAEFGRKSFESATTHFRGLSTVKSPTEPCVVNVFDPFTRHNSGELSAHPHQRSRDAA